MTKPGQRKAIKIPKRMEREFLAEVESGADFLDTLYSKLKEWDGGERAGVGYALTNDNQFGAGLVAQTPPGLWGKKAGDYKIGAGAFLVNRIRDLIGNAEKFVDITTLCQFPDGQFKAGIQNGLKKLASSGRHVRVRILAGYYPSAMQKQSVYLEDLIQPLKTAGGNLEIFVAAQRTDTISWNHAKIVAVDGKRAILGGENQWDGDYLEKAPVHDLNVELAGSAVYHMHLFADAIWKSVCKYWLPDWKPAYWKSGAKKVTTKCLPNCGLKKIPGRGQVSVLGVARFGRLYSKHPNPADYAMLLSIRAAQKVVQIAQQDLGLGPLYWKPGMQAIAEALVRGCDVYVVLSDDDGKAGSGSSYSTTTVADTADHIKGYVKAVPNAPKGKKLTELLCNKLHLTTLRFGPSNKWPDPPYEFANHSKFLMVDDKVFYVGSENLYPSDLIEYGVFMNDPAAMKQIRAEYWDKLWKYSERVAITGNGTATCYFK